jgi:hypothetical protein
MRKLVPTEEEMREIQTRCDEYGYDLGDPVVVQNMTAILRGEKHPENKVGVNVSLLRDKSVMTYDGLPTAPKAVVALIALWRSKRTNDEIASGQVGGQARTLRDAGFLFKGTVKDDGMPSVRVTFWEAGKEYRMIVGFDPNAVEGRKLWNKLSKEEVRVVKDGHKRDLMGIAPRAQVKQIDHRMPEQMRKSLGVEPVPLTRDLLISGEYDTHYQIVASSTNDIKREVCKACMRNEDIRLPNSVQPFRSAYRKRQAHPDHPPCYGCFWFNHLKPLHPELAPDLEKSCQEHEVEVRAVMRAAHSLPAPKPKEKKDRASWTT